VSLRDVTVPSLGDFKNVPVVEVLVKVGQTIQLDEALLTLETDKATMDVPAPYAGTITEVLVTAGQKLNENDVICRVSVSQAAAAPVKVTAPPTAAVVTAEAPAEAGRADQQFQLVVLGAGPGGYTAAFRAADLGLKVALIERWPTLGGVCLNVGCIPSKALLHAAKIIDEADSLKNFGVKFADPDIDITKLRTWKESVIGKLTQGLSGLARQRKVTVINGDAEFLSQHRIAVQQTTGSVVIGFDQCIIAAGSEPVKLADYPNDPRIMDSTGALALTDIPKRLLVVGGGIIGLEMASVYAALGSQVTLVELGPHLMPGCDRDLVKPLEKRLKLHIKDIHVSTKVVAVKATKKSLQVSFEGASVDAATQEFDRILVAVGRVPNGGKIGAQKAGVTVTERGFIPVDKQQRTNVPHIFAIGDIVGQPMLAHKATHEGKVAAEVACGHKRFFDAKVIPSVAYTDPEIAWVGLNETEAKQKGIVYEKGSFPWAASGRSLALNRDEGLTKILFDPNTKRILGAGIVGPNAGDLIAEAALAIEMNADAHDLGLTIHPHPTLSETLAFAAEAFDGSLTDLYIPKKK
jgi:dihydrolipoamide dehydrogenase